MENDNIIILNDDEGNEVEFEFLDLIAYRGKEYVILLPVSNDAVGVRRESAPPLYVTTSESIDMHMEHYR